MSARVGINFCPNCANILYPKEDKLNKILLYACKNCDHKEKAKSNCVYFNEIVHVTKELENIPKDVTDDITLARSKDHPCPKCKNLEAVFFQAEISETMRIYFACKNPSCKHTWTSN